MQLNIIDGIKFNSFWIEVNFPAPLQEKIVKLLDQGSITVFPRPERDKGERWVHTLVWAASLRE